MTNTFSTPIIRSYGRTQLAMIYFPDMCRDAAYRKLKSWITGCKGLVEALAKVGYCGHKRTFTPAQVALIFEYLGEP